MNGVLISTLVGYLLGSIPFGLLIAKTHGIDIRKHGSGNIGATNVLRTLGKKWGVLVFVLDALKGVLAVLVAAWFLGNLTPLGNLHFSAVGLGIVAGIACILGHNYPIWLGFKGGKGVATSCGVLLGLAPLAVSVGLLIWVAVFYSSRYVSAASIAAAVIVPLVVLARALITGSPVDAVFWFSLVASALAIWRHKANIQRLLAGTEHRFEKKK